MEIADNILKDKLKNVCFIWGSVLRRYTDSMIPLRFGRNGNL